MSRWTDLARRVSEKYPRANSANSANRPRKPSIGTNGTNGTRVSPENEPSPPPGDPLEVAAALAGMEPNSEAEAAFIRKLEAQGWSRRELVELLNRDTIRRARRPAPAQTTAEGGPAPEEEPDDLEDAEPGRCPDCGGPLPVVSVPCRVRCPGCGSWCRVRPGQPKHHGKAKP